MKDFGIYLYIRDLELREVRTLGLYISYERGDNMIQAERSERGLGSGGNCVCPSLIDSEMAGQIRIKFGGMVDGMEENILAKEFFNN